MGESNKALFGRIIDVIDDVMKSSTGSAGIVPRSAIDQLADVGRAEAAYAAYECKLIDERNYGSHTLLAGEVVAAHLLEEAFTAEGLLDLTRVSPALFLGIDYYVGPDKNSIKYLDRKIHGRC